MFDNIDLEERDHDGDALILDLFHQWTAALKDANDISHYAGCDNPEEKAFEATMDIVLEIEHRLASTAASGVAGLAIKGLLAADRARPVFDPFLIGIIKDGSRLVPELAPLAGEILAVSASDDQAEGGDAGSTENRMAEIRKRAEALMAEYAGPMPLGDDGLIEAERRQRGLAQGISALSRELKVSMKEEEIGLAQAYAAEHEYWDLIGDAEPETLAGIAVKLRWVRTQSDDPEVGTGFVLGQCLDALEARDRRASL
jgi:hypothetical protein